MPAMATIQETAGEAAGWFETAERPGGDTFTRLKDGAPDWVGELVRKAHGADFLPDDWRYQCIRAALDFIADDSYDDPEDGAHEFADQHADVYTAGRLAWLSSNLNRAGYVDQAVEELGQPDPFSVVDAIGMGQYLEAREVFYSVMKSLGERSQV